jgi:hypothetical protein
LTFRQNRPEVSHTLGRSGRNGCVCMGSRGRPYAGHADRCAFCLLCVRVLHDRRVQRRVRAEASGASGGLSSWVARTNRCATRRQNGQYHRTSLPRSDRAPCGLPGQERLQTSAHEPETPAGTLPLPSHSRTDSGPECARERNPTAHPVSESGQDIRRRNADRCGWALAPLTPLYPDADPTAREDPAWCLVPSSTRRGSPRASGRDPTDQAPAGNGSPASRGPADRWSSTSRRDLSASRAVSRAAGKHLWADSLWGRDAPLCARASACQGDQHAVARVATGLQHPGHRRPAIGDHEDRPRPTERLEPSPLFHSSSQRRLVAVDAWPIPWCSPPARLFRPQPHDRDHPSTTHRPSARSDPLWTMRPACCGHPARAAGKIPDDQRPALQRLWATSARNRAHGSVRAPSEPGTHSPNRHTLNTLSARCCILSQTC